jgi:hypothetical protein
MLPIRPITKTGKIGPSPFSYYGIGIVAGIKALRIGSTQQSLSMSYTMKPESNCQKLHAQPGILLSKVSTTADQ